VAEPPRSGSARPLDDPAYRAAVIDLLGFIAYGEVSAFDRLAQDARSAPTLADRSEVSRMAAAEFGHYERLCAELRRLGADPYAAMAPFVAPVDAFHARTASSDWLEGLVTAYVGDGLAADFYAEIAQFVDPDTRGVVLGSLSEAGHSAFVVDRVRTAIVADPRVSGRLALWGRRLMGEALIQSQRVAAERAELTALLSGAVTGVERSDAEVMSGRPGLDVAALARLFTRLTENHTRRMESLGLDA
jgi:tRNA-(MS[2]IO[6]A)-hydroxylase (MiaE)-like